MQAVTVEVCEAGGTGVRLGESVATTVYVWVDTVGRTGVFVFVSAIVAGIVGVCVCASSAVAVSTTTDVAVRVFVMVDANGTVCVGVGVRLGYVVGVLIFVVEGEKVGDVVGVAVTLAREPTHVEACVSLFV